MCVTVTIVSSRSVSSCGVTVTVCGVLKLVAENVRLLSVFAVLTDAPVLASELESDTVTSADGVRSSHTVYLPSSPPSATVTDSFENCNSGTSLSVTVTLSVLVWPS